MAKLTRSVLIASFPFLAPQTRADWLVDYAPDYTAYAVDAFANGAVMVGSHYSAVQSAIWVAKLDSKGSIDWQRTYSWPGGGPVGGSAVREAPDGMAVLGWTYEYESGLRRPWVLKLDASGAVQWQTVFALTPTTFADTPSTIDAFSDGWLVTGYAREMASQPRGEAMAAKLTQDGKLAWVRSYNLNPSTTGRAYSVAYSGIAMPDGQAVLVGSSMNPGEPSAAFVLKLTPEGDLEQAVVYSGASAGAGDSGFEGIQPTKDGGYLAVGWIVLEC